MPRVRELWELTRWHPGPSQEPSQNFMCDREPRQHRRRYFLSSGRHRRRNLLCSGSMFGMIFALLCCLACSSVIVEEPAKSLVRGASVHSGLCQVHSAFSYMRSMSRDCAWLCFDPAIPVALRGAVGGMTHPYMCVYQYVLTAKRKAWFF